jgi:uncharacterized protein with ATP-grasp and redox domains
MELSPECPACAAIQMTRALAHHGRAGWKSASSTAFTAMGQSLAAADASPGSLLSALYAALSDTNVTADPYRQEKTWANQLAEEFLAKSPKDRANLHRLALIATAGNVLDGAVNPDPRALWSTFEDAVALGFQHDDWDVFEKALEPGQSLLYLMDNAGEAVFDRELIRALGLRGFKVTVVVRGAPYLNDLTVDEAVDLGFLDLARVIDSGTSSTGFMPERVGDEARAALDDAGAVIAKGIANLETLSHHRLSQPVLFLYRSKCPPSARLASVHLDSNVAWLQR